MTPSASRTGRIYGDVWGVIFDGNVFDLFSDYFRAEVRISEVTISIFLRSVVGGCRKIIRWSLRAHNLLMTRYLIL